MVIFHSYASLPESMGIAAKNAINATKNNDVANKASGNTCNDCMLITHR